MNCQKCRKEIPVSGPKFCPFCGKKVTAGERNVKTRGNGEGCAYKRGNSYVAKVTVGWKKSPNGDFKIPIRATKGGFRTKKDAINYCATLMANYQKPTDAPTLEYYWDIYKERKLPALSQSKQTAYKIAWNKIEKLQHRKMDSITVADLCGSVDGLTYYPARDVKVLLNHLYKLAGADGWVNKELPEYIELPKLEEKKREPFTIEEQKKLWESYEAGNKMAEIPLIMIYSGLMPGEIMSMTTEMVDLESKRIVGVGMKTATRKAAPVYLADSILPVVAAAIEGKEGKIWRYNKDNFYANYYQALRNAGVRELSPYSCRHTTATALAVDLNIAPQTASKIMRWSSSKMLDRYAHPDDVDALAAVNALKKVE